MGILIGMSGERIKKCPVKEGESRGKTRPDMPIGKHGAILIHQNDFGNPFFTNSVKILCLHKGGGPL